MQKKKKGSYEQDFLLLYLDISKFINGQTFRFDCLSNVVSIASLPIENELCSICLQPTVPAEGRKPPRIGNIGHLTRLSNKLVQLGSSNAEIEAYLKVHF